MSTNQFDLKNLSQLRRVITVINDNPDAADNMRSRFPFHQLSEVSSLEIEVIREICQVFALFGKHCTHIEDTSAIPQFYCHNIQFQADSEECDFTFLAELLQLLKRELERDVHFIIERPSIEATLHSIVHHPAVNPAVLKLAVEVFTQLLKRPSNRNSIFSTVCAGLWKAAGKLQLEQRLALLRNLICYTDSTEFPDVDKVYAYLIETVKVIFKCEDELIKVILNCAILTFEKCKQKSVLLTLSVTLACINFPKCIAHFFLHDVSHFPLMHELLFYEISTIFEKTPWNSAQDNLRAVITYLEQPFLLKHDPDVESRSELEFVIFYLELVYKNLRHRNLPIVKDMVKKFGGKLPTNPAVLKAIYLLFAAYGDMELLDADRHFQSDLLLSMQHCKELANYLSYHVAELVWVLKYGSRILKMQVVALWVRQKDEEVLGHLWRCLRECEQQKCLLEVVCFDSNPRVKSVAMDLFQHCAQNPRAQLVPLLRRPDLTTDTLNCIMHGSPAKIELGADPESAQYRENLTTILALIRRLIDLITQDDLNLLRSTKTRMILYLFTICREIRLTEHATCYVSGKLVTELIEGTKSDSSSLSCNAFQFLMLIITTQESLKISFSEQIVVEPIPLVGCAKRTLCAVRFYQHLLEPPAIEAEPRMLTLEDHLGLYHHLMDVLTCEVGPAVYQLVVSLLERYEECVGSVINIFAIRVHSREFLTNVNFIKYLTIWCQLASNYKYIKIPVKSIVPLIKYLDSIQYKDADYAILKTIINSISCSYKEQHSE